MIGIFDSGFGGLAILKEIHKLLPEYNYLYLGDSAREPYGNRSRETIYKFSQQAVDYLFKEGCQVVIIACGTASSAALRRLQQEYLPNNFPDRRILGIIKPLVEKAVLETRYGRLGVVGTRGTIYSDTFKLELEKENGSGKNGKKLEIFQEACPLLVPLIEEGWTEKPETRMILKKYLKPLKIKKVDTLLLGCTHYPILYRDFRRIMGKNCQVLHTGEVVAASLKDYLKRHPEMETRLEKKGKVTFLSTDDPKIFDRLGSKYFGKNIKAKLVDIAI